MSEPQGAHPIPEDLQEAYEATKRGLVACDDIELIERIARLEAQLAACKKQLEDDPNKFISR